MKSYTSAWRDWPEMTYSERISWIAQETLINLALTVILPVFGSMAGVANLAIWILILMWIAYFGFLLALYLKPFQSTKLRKDVPYTCPYCKRGDLSYGQEYCHGCGKKLYWGTN